ncbi:MAG: SagB/ThcOx family dehydrogenase [Nitrososphaerota archaeon]
MFLSPEHVSGKWGSDKARRYHEATKHSYASVRVGSGYLDFSNKPYPFKYYISGEKKQLPAEFERPVGRATDALTCSLSIEAPKTLSISHLASLLYFTAGISRVERVGDHYIYFRVAPATGALYSTELYPVIGWVEDVEAGVYHFDPGEFVLTRLRSGDFRRRIAETIQDQGAASARLLVILTACGWRNAWKYRERSYRHWFWDGGAMAANLLAVACSFGLDAKVHAGFVDDEVNSLLGVDGEDEAVFAVITVDGRVEAAGAEAPERVAGPIEGVPAAQRGRPVKYSLISETHASTMLRSSDEVASWKKSAALLHGLDRDGNSGLPVQAPQPATTEKRIWEVILERGSTRKFARRSIGASQLSAILRYSFGPLRADFLPDTRDTLIRPYLIVNAVEGMPSGCYRYIPSTGELRLLRKGQFREAAGYLCLEQALGRDASIVFFNMADLDKVLNVLGGRGYRAAQLEGGIRLGRLYLSAYSVGLGATGLTFYDDDCVEFFSPSSDGLEVMTVVAIGYPSYTTRPGSIKAGILKHPAKAL